MNFITLHMVSKVDGTLLMEDYGGSELQAAEAFMRSVGCYECKVNGDIYLATVSGKAVLRTAAHI